MATHHWHTGHNMPGYMPDGEVGTHRDFEDAKASLVDDLTLEADSVEWDEVSDEIIGTIADVKLATSPGEWATPDGYVNWITHCTDEACEADLAGGA